MKTQIKRFSKSTLAVVLSLCMLISCMTVGIIATDAAKVSDSGAIAATSNDEGIGDATYYYHYGIDNGYWSSNGKAMTQSGTTWYADVDFTTQYNNYIRINTTSNSINNSNTTSVSSQYTNNYSSVVNKISYDLNVNSGYAGYKIELKSAPSSSTKVRISFDTSDMSTLIVSDPSGSGGSSGGGESGGDSGDTKTIYVGVISHISTSDISSKLKVHYWGGAESGDVTGTYMNSTKSKAVGSSYWNNEAQTFYMYEFSIPSDSTGMKAWIDEDSDRWFGDDGNASDYNTIYIFNYSGDKALYANEEVTYSGLSAKLKIDGTETTKTGFSASLGATSGVSGTTGTSATAVNGDSTNYQFDGWTSSNGTFTNASSLSATFKPSANSAVAYANFSEKTYSVSVSSSNTSMGNVSPSSISAKPLTATNLSTITVNPESGYKFNGWTKTGSVTLTGNSATDSTAGTIKATATGGTLTANFTAESYNLSKGSETNGTFTLSPAAGSVAYGTTVTVNCSPASDYKVGSVQYGSSNAAQDSSDPNKWTFSMPAAATTVTVNFVPIDHGITTSVNPTGVGSVTVSKSDDGAATATYNQGDTLYLKGTVTNSAYTFTNFTVIYGDSTTETVAATNNKATISMAGKTGAITVIGNFTAKPTYSITTKSNNNSYGSVTTDISEAYEGQTVTVTITEGSGTFKSVTATATNGTSVTLNGTGTTRTFTMPAQAVKVTATFEEYVGVSNYYYNGYTTSAGQVSGKFAQRMTEGKLNGKTYSYYHVTGRSGGEQLMTVSYGNLDYTNSSTWVYFTRPSWNDTSLWGNSESQYALFYSSDQTIIKDWEAMAGDGSTDGGYRFKIQVPDRAVFVRFKDGSTQHETSLINLNNKNGGTYSHNGFYLSSSTHSDNTYTDIGTYDMVDGLNKIPDVYEWYQTSTDNGTVYKNSANTIGFGNYGVTEVSAIGNASYHRFAKPNTSSSDYYVLLLYQGVEYTINDTTIKDDNNIVVLISETLPSDDTGEESDTVKIYAKDSTLRSGYTFYNKYATTNLTDSAYATTSPKYTLDGTDTEYTVTGYSDGGIHTYDYTSAVPKGSTIYFKTVMDDSDMKSDSGAQSTDKFRSNYYLKGYSINGTVYKIFDSNGTEAANGTYTQSFTIPEDWAYDYVEITPIYWLKSSANTMVFYVQGYTDEVINSGWGNTIGVYPFYQDEFNVAAKGSQNAYGGYPGQPLVNYKGDLFAQIPVQYAGTNENGVAKTMYIKGITMSNMYWDYVHLATGEVNKHHQTYDYDDLYKIYQEKKENGNSPDNIICSFKYENNHNNDEPSRLTVTEADLAVYSNGWEDLTNFAGDLVDIFGNTNPTGDPLYVISQDYRSNCAGKYATEWAVYDSDGSKITTIVPSALILNSVASFDNYDAETLKFKTAYQTLSENYSGRPVKITYEQSIWGGSDQAERCDARWYYSRNGETVTASIKIQTSEDNGKTWTDAEISNLGVATVGGETLTAVFDEGTYASASDLIHTAELELDKEQYYKFTATQSANYKFDSWQVERDGAIQQVTNVLGDSEEVAPRSGNAVFIARFKHVVNNKFNLYHEIHPQSAGVGTVNITAQKYTSDTTTIAGAASGTTVGAAQTGTSVTFDVENTETNVLLATFTADPRSDSTFDNFYENVNKVLTSAFSSGLSYVLDFNIDTENNKFEILYDIDKLYSGTTLSHASDTFYSKFGFKERNYKIDYFFDTFKYGKKVYTVTGKITSDDAKNYFKDQLATSSGFTSLNAAFVSSKTPAESNYREDLKWNSSDVQILPDEGTTLRAKLVAEQTPYNVCRAKIVDSYNGNEITKIIETTYGSHFLDNGSEYVAQNTEHISYWSVYKYKGGTDMVEIARCYGTSFNYTAYEDYYIVAHYDELDDGVSRQEAYNAQKKGYASLVSISRNHWNNCAKNTGTDEEPVWQIDTVDGDGTYNRANTEYDRLYSDFILGFDYNGLDLSSDKQGYTIKYKVEKYTGETLAATQEITVSAVDNKNRVHCTLGIGNTEVNANYNTKFVITPMLIKNGTDVLSGKADSIEIKFYSIANSEREWVD